ncbi:nucleotide pyrophosphohydrolase [Staphylococcus condimenti]|uniref:nucleotide pyrophosphohydrolase n=1 Tax=Staphylococcus TaxID=1279 RepID=UPI0008A3FFAE|nr:MULTISPECIES: nucleotide pyrophosphohydrolase [Staphylococcus]APR59912.1 nucleotide pyrophosphohydrolase [Staphylococcus condimenti]MDK8646102.1 nucleotide pyrophosphohydrolase [Staphylococcus condimenti]OFP03733.1 nucleotide pyrophosphohydrolase [Staphylococcus sp. HMSC065E08]
MNNTENLIQEINDFREARNWRQYHNEKDLAISLSLEASELLELYQWKQPEEVNKNSRERIEEELADVLIYSYMIADNLNMDIDDIIRKKIVKNGQKYPVQKSKNSNKKYDEL